MLLLLMAKIEIEGEALEERIVRILRTPIEEIADMNPRYLKLIPIDLIDEEYDPKKIV